ncbi:hypothetical protein [Sphingomonas bacterium]|uniref:hypothetical protein n=1 Tax=Sphingomonas bacterium TaxID=1895847 RepID=UPI002611416C|nr:hypothetical protein [Sphingomonas bacterium]MDB5679392.1 hypothetical protein [Sphingomonas bacterium]
MKQAIVLGVGLLLAGCGETMARPATPSAAPARPISTTGLDRVTGQNAAELTRTFGNPDADVREGSARKLQFKGPICVLDTYLYPGKGGGEPTVTYVDTRQPDGSPIDRASCVAALARRGGGK